jgi:hypothetical protein
VHLRYVATPGNPFIALLILLIARSPFLTLCINYALSLVIKAGSLFVAPIILLVRSAFLTIGINYALSLAIAAGSLLIALLILLIVRSAFLTLGINNAPYPSPSQPAAFSSLYSFFS